MVKIQLLSEYYTQVTVTWLLSIYTYNFTFLIYYKWTIDFHIYLSYNWRVSLTDSFFSLTLILSSELLSDAYHLEFCGPNLLSFDCLALSRYSKKQSWLINQICPIFFVLNIPILNNRRKYCWLYPLLSAADFTVR